MSNLRTTKSSLTLKTFQPKPLRKQERIKTHCEDQFDNNEDETEMKSSDPRLRSTITMSGFHLAGSLTQKVIFTQLRFRSIEFEEISLSPSGRGVRWLVSHFHHNAKHDTGGSLLADDMGLVKPT